jgi:cytidylate kinase
LKHHLVIAIDGPSASGKSSTARLVARSLGYVFVDTGAMFRTLAWHCQRNGLDVHDPKAVANACRRWKTSLTVAEGDLRQVRLLVDGYYPEQEIRTAQTSAAVAHVAAIPKVREWMKKTQRACRELGNLVMEGRDIGTAVFPETDYKFFLDAPLKARKERREKDGVNEDLAARDKRDSDRPVAPLMMALGAVRVDNSHLTLEQTAAFIVAEFQRRLPAPKPT